MSSVLDDAAAGQGVEPQFQRVVSLPDETVVGYEALARWPGLRDVGPLDVFARARVNGTLERWTITASALRHRPRCGAVRPRACCC